MAELSDDLIEVVAIYTVFDPTIILTSLSREGVRRVYRRNGGLWRNKAKYETLGLTLDESVIPDWLLYYQMIRRQFYGKVVAPYPDPKAANITVDGVTHLAETYESLISVIEGNTLRLLKKIGEGLYNIPLPARVRQVFAPDIMNMMVLLETGRVLELTKIRKRAKGRSTEWSPTDFDIKDKGVTDIAEIYYGGEEWWYITRAGETGAVGEEDHPELPPITDAIKLIQIESEEDRHYIDRFGKPFIGQEENKLSILPEDPVVHFTETGSGITTRGQLRINRNYLEGISKWRYSGFGDPDFRYIAIFDRPQPSEGDVPGAALITAKRELKIFDRGYRDVISLPGYDRYAGQIETCSGEYLLVASTEATSK